MRTFVKKHWLLFLILLGGLAVVLFLITRGGAQPPSPSPSPTSQPFTLLHAFPPGGKQELGDPGLALSFSFSAPIELASVVITLNPYINFDLFIDPSGETLYVRPLPKWDYNVEYKINISLKSKDGRGLSSPIEQVFTFTQMRNSPLSE